MKQSKAARHHSRHKGSRYSGHQFRADPLGSLEAYCPELRRVWGTKFDQQIFHRPMRCQAASSMHQRSPCQGLAGGSHTKLAGCGHDPPPQEPPPWGWCCARAVLAHATIADPKASSCRPCNHGKQARLAARCVAAHPTLRHTSQPTIGIPDAVADLMQLASAHSTHVHLHGSAQSVAWR